MLLAPKRPQHLLSHVFIISLSTCLFHPLLDKGLALISYVQAL